MSNYLALDAYQRSAGGLAAGVDVIPWGSAAAQEAINRICQEVTARCEQVIATQTVTDGNNQGVETRSSPVAGTETEGHQP